MLIPNCLRSRSGVAGRVLTSKEEELEHKFLYSRLRGQGISYLLTKLLIEHVKIQSDDPETSMIATRGMLEWSLASFVGSVRTEDSIEIEINDEVRGRIRMILDVIEREARESLGLAPPVKERH